MKLLSSSSSTVSLLQPFDLKLAQNLLGFLKNKQDFVEDVHFSQELQLAHPYIFNLINNIRICDEKLFDDVFILFEAIVEHVIAVYNQAESRTENDYVQYDGEEIKTQYFPSFPLLRYRAKYKMDGKDDSLEEDKCNKIFPEHWKFTPGLWLMCCSCPAKKVLGFTTMTSKESPRMMFDLKMTRFPLNYNPTIVFDASCLSKEMGLNRELKIYMENRSVTDNFHEENHTGCVPSFRSSLYTDLQSRNTEACEQFNALLRRVGTSLMFMNLDHYINAVRVFCSMYNLR